MNKIFGHMSSWSFVSEFSFACGFVSSYPCPSYPSFCVARGVHKDLIS